MKNYNISLFIFFLIFVLLCGSCKNDGTSSVKKSKKLSNNTATNEALKSDQKLFKKLTSAETGIDFTNKIQESNGFNYFTYEYIYNGGGVAVGDINNDGLPDLFYTANLSFNKLYLNKGNLKFEDISKTAGIEASRDWCTGVTMVDINNDGWLDIYVSRSVWFNEPNNRRNQLYINNKDLTFTEQSASYGIDDPGYSSQVSFFDFDRDNDLDLYVANHPVNFKERLIEGMERRKNPPIYQSDQLYRNDGGKFTNITKEAGITNYGYALGIVTSDLDNDGWTDIFVSNDYAAPNFYYRNKGDGTFEDLSLKMLKHSSRFSMGADIADINNDGLYDIYTTEMMSEDHRRQKTNMAAMSSELFWAFVKEDYGYQYMHNCLQLNQGKAPFSEISYLSGVATTDWSWSPLIADFNNDGHKDIFVSNGQKRDVLDKDFNIKKGGIVKSNTNAYSQIEDYIPVTKIANYIFQNNGDLSFKKQSFNWGISDLMNTNGASYADLDNDGDLDLILNNMDEVSVIYENQLLGSDNDKSNYLKIKFEGPKNNTSGLGARVSIKYNDQEQHHELLSTRGYQSSVEPILHLGLGAASLIDEVKILWPDQKTQSIKKVKTGQLITIKYEDAKIAKPIKGKMDPVFASANNFIKNIRPHKEKDYDDYSKQLLLPHKQSQFGPSVAVGDVNGDGLEDIFVGGANGQVGVIAFQQSSGIFKPQKSTALDKDQSSEDMGALFFDVEGDGDLDLYVASGSYEFEENDNRLQDRLYINDGSGQFTKENNALPKMLSNTSCVVAGDFDGDKDLDLFIGGMTKHGKYPLADDSYILKNDGGSFSIANKEVFEEPLSGLVKTALWTDYDGDMDLDLIVTGEWMPIRVYKNENGKLKEQSNALGLDKTAGWWNSISSGDFDNDGDTDYILGNLGLNSKNKASQNAPFTIFAKDFDQNNTFDVALGFYENGVCYPLRGKQCSSEQVPAISQKIPDYTTFANSTMQDIYGSNQIGTAVKREAFQFASCYMENKGASGFVLYPLPNEAQIAPSFGTMIQDFDRDGCLDVLLVGNQYPIEIETTRQDAHRGVLLKGDCNNKFQALSVPETGILNDGDAKSIAWVAHNKSEQPLILVANNNGKLSAFSINTLESNKGFQFKNNDQADFVNSPQGGGYLSQSSNKKWTYKR